MPHRAPSPLEAKPRSNPESRLPSVEAVKHSPSSEEAQPLIRMLDIVKTYKTHAGDFPALKGVSADFYPGQFVSIIGKSGSGKSTLLNMLTGIDRPNSGTIQIGDTYLQKLSESEFSIWRGRNLGIVFQFFQLLPMLSLLENTILPMDFCNMYQPTERMTRAVELLGMVGLENFLHKPPAAVSSGQEQCAAIARALANDPPIIVADEPTGNLDSKTAEMVLGIIDDLVSRGKTIVVVTHDETVASRASRVMVICDGELVDEHISSAYPDLSHRTMLMLSHKMKTQTFPAESVISQPESERPGCLIVTNGRLEISSADSDHRHFIGAGKSLSRFDEVFNDGGQPVLRASSHAPLEIKYLNEPDLAECLAAAHDLEPCLRHLPQKSFLSKYAEESKQTKSTAPIKAVGS
ncbi:MAG: ABC transporter ATP-binding protein [Anaerolineaceae bacterium]